MTTSTDADAYRLYGYTLSYFTRKLEAALDWYGVSYEFLIKTPDIGPELEQRSGTRQVPVLVTPEGDTLADTTPIMWLLDEHLPNRAMFPMGVMGAIAQIMEEYLDEWLSRIVMHYRWNFDECAELASVALGKEAAPQASGVVAAMLTQWGRKVIRARGLTSPSMQQAAEAEWIRLLDALEGQLQQTAFTLGTRPCAVDAVLLGGLRGHFKPDPVPARILESYPQISRWIDEANRWSGGGAILDSLDEAPFARFLLGEMSGAYRTYMIANRLAVETGEKAFVCETYGETISYKTQAYTETSRARTVERLHSRLNPADWKHFTSLLQAYGLADVFGVARSHED